MNELAALVAGRWDAFAGLAECTVTEADALLGPPLEDELHGGMFGGEPAQFRRYPGTAASPQGVTCWILDDVVVGVEIAEPEPDPEALASIGPPDLELGSELGASWRQDVWTARGLVVHRRDDRIRIAFGLVPTDADAWLEDPLRWWRAERRSR